MRATLRPLWLMFGLALASLALGCAEKSNRGTPAGGGTGSQHQGPDADACRTPQEGCPCESPGKVIECGSVARRSAGYTSCSMGERVCDDGEWGACEGDKIVQIADPAPDQQQAQALGTSQPCIDNPCDPFCQIVVDNGANLNVGGGFTVTDGGLSLTAVPPDPAANTCTDILLDPPTQTLTVSEFVPTKGLLGSYYAQFSTSVTAIPNAWPVTATRVDTTVNFDWGNNAPGPGGIGVDGFSVRWDGYVRSAATEDYIFYVRGDDGVRLWVDGTLVIPKSPDVSWKNQGATQYASNAITLTAGVAKSIRMEYFDNSGGAVAQLKWSSASIAEQIIPDTALSPTANYQSPFVTTPANATITASVVPPTCYDGAFTAAWSLDRLDRATVSNGVVSLQTAVSGPIAVRADVQEFSDTAIVNVVVNATENIEAPPGTPAIFAGASTGADTATILYPYDATVLPIALKPPVLQWDTGADTASAVKVSLTYPAVGAPTYQWSKIMAAPSNSRYAFTRDQWEPFERTAKAGTGRISLQRIVMGQLKDEVSKTIVFASTPLRGKIYYTQYGNGAKIMRLDPGADLAPVNAFGNNDGCPVCHSMSANGSKFATSNWTYSTINGGISDVNSAGDLVRLADFPNPSGSYGGGGDSRGYAWAPFTPDGKYIFTTTAIYGNTNQAIVGIDTATNTVLLPATQVSGGRGTGLLADYYSAIDFTGPSWRRIDAHPDFDWTGAPGGPLPVDNYSVVWSGEVEGLYTESTTFEVETNTGVRLTVGGNVIIDDMANTLATTLSGTANLTKGVKTAIRLEVIDGAAATTKARLWWRSLSTLYTLIPQSQLFPAGGQHGAVAVYQDATAGPFTRLESDLVYDWGTERPMRGRGDTTQNISADNFTSTWDAQVEAPATTNITWCIQSDDGYAVTVDGTPVLTSAASTGAGVYVCSAAATAVTEGQRLAVHVAHTEGTGSARMRLAWVMSSFITTREDIPMARTFPPATYTPPTNGLSATFYDTPDFGGATLAQNATTYQAYNTYIPTIDYDWTSGRFSMSRAFNDNDNWSARITGRLQPACTGMHEFQAQGDDQVTVWIGNERLIRRTSNGTSTNHIWLDAAQLYDFKVDFIENTGNAVLKVKWKPLCTGATVFTAIPEANLFPTGDTTLNGYLRGGGDNSSGAVYTAWESTTTVGTLSTDVTAQSVGNWGLAKTSMMVPTFSPDGTKLVFVDGDSATGAGWRKGLSTFDFDQTGKLFKNRRQMVNHFPYGDVIKWPTYESDSQSVIYQTTTPGDSCCTNNSWTKYGYMGPSNYFEDPGKQWSIDTTAANPTPVELVKLNSGERAVDRNKAYQATMLPAAAGGYRWAVFTTTRPYGNTINLPAVQQDYTDVNNYVQMLNTSQLQSMLWVSAIDDTVSAGTDRSHPAFFLPNQAYSESGTHYLNERAYWVTESCRASGSGAGSTCDVDEDCCGATAMPKTAVCRIDSPLTSPPTRHCASVPAPNTCFAAGAACSVNTDCCFNYPCVANVCVKPPPLPTYHPENYQRMYTSECGKGTLPVWRFFDWQAVTPPIDSAIEIYAESSDDPNTFQVLPESPTVVMLSGVVKIATVTGATVAGWVGEDVGAKLTAAGVPQRKYLMITLRLIPNTKITATPTVTDWRQAYSCPPQE